MNEYVYYLAPLVGFIANVAGGFWGLGGGWFIVPSLLVFGVPDVVAVGASLLQMVFSTMPTVGRQFKSIGWKRGGWGISLALPLCLMSFLGGFFGCPLGEFVEYLSNHSRKPHQVIYFLLLAFIFYKTLCSRDKAHDDNAVAELKPWKPGIIGFIIGAVSAMLGIGGGAITRPAMKGLLGVPENITGKISRLAVSVTAVSGSISYLSGMKGFHAGDPGRDSLVIGLLLAVGGFAGFALGAWIHGKVLAAGQGAKAGRSFAWMVLPVMVALGFKIFNLPLWGCGAIFFAGIFLMFYLLRMYDHARSINKKDLL
ncbi:MAG: sulfite exporter TauE/SafE family protein [Victivallaceae bacterium]